jgi:hypothetical protein
MVRRRVDCKKSTVLLGLIVLAWFGYRRAPSPVGSGRELFLEEGLVRVIRIEDAQTLVVRSLDGPAARNGGDFRLRLCGIRPIDSPERESKSDAARAEAITRRFVDECPQRIVRVVFDGQRFDETETPIAFVYSGKTCLNAELLRAQAVQLVQYPGMPSKRMRELIKVAAGGLTSSTAWSAGSKH